MDNFINQEYIKLYNSIPNYKKGYWKFLSFASKKDLLLFTFGIIFSILQGFSLISFAFIFGNVWNSFTQNNSSTLLNINNQIINFLYFGLAAFFSCWIGYLCFYFSGKSINKKMKLIYFKKLLEKDSYYFDLNNINEINSKFINDVIIFDNALSEKLNNLFYNLGVILGGFIYSFYTGWLISILILCIFPILLISIILYLYYYKKSFDLSKKSYSEAGSITEEIFSMIKIVKYNNAEEFEINNFKNAIKNHEKKAKKYSIIIGFLTSLFIFLYFIIYSIGLLIGTIFINNGIINYNTGKIYNLGEIISIFLSILGASYSFSQLSPNIISFTKLLKTYTDIDKFLTTKNIIEIDEMDGLKPLHLNGDIEFKNVSFSYPTLKNKMILKNMSFKIKAGESIAFVGESGSGKSTIIQLLERYYDVNEGEIWLDGINIKKYNLFYLRNLFGIVSQNIFWLGTTVRDNLNLNISEINIKDDKILYESLKLTNIDKNIKNLKNGLDEFIGLNGSKFSGGQRQRISISRTLLKNNNILLLDEATSALDKNNEYIIQNCIKKKYKNSTIINITHRLDSIKDYNNIYVIKNGEIVEKGTHNELIDLNKEYFKLYKLQGLETKIIEKNEIENEIKIKKKIFRRRFKKLTTLEKLKYIKDKIILDLKKNNIFKLLNLKLMALGLFFSVLNGLIFPIFGYLYSEILVNLINIINNVNKTVNINNSYILISLMFGLSVLSLIFSFISNSILNYIGETYSNNLRIKYFRTLIYKDSKFFDKEKNKPANLNSELIKDCKEINLIITIYLSLLIQNITTIITGLIISFYSSWRISLTNFLIIPLIALGGLVEIDIQNDNKNGVDNKKNSKRQDFSILNEALNNIKQIWSLSAHKKIFYMYFQSLINNNNLIKKKIIKAVLYAFSQFNLFGSYALLFFLGNYILQNFDENFKDINRAIFTLIFTGFSVGITSQFILNISNSINAKNNLEKRFNEKNKIEKNINEQENLNKNNKIYNKKFEKSKIKGKIEFKNVKFRYNKKSSLILNKLSFIVKPGENIVFVGKSGCGKSTIIQLLLRFYEIESGEILLDDKNIKNYDINNLRSIFGFISQDTRWFNKSILYNITYPNKNINNNQIINYSKSILAFKFIKNSITIKDEKILKMDKNNKLDNNNIKLKNKKEKPIKILRQNSNINKTNKINLKPKLIKYNSLTSLNKSITIESCITKNSNKNIMQINKIKSNIFIWKKDKTIKNNLDRSSINKIEINLKKLPEGYHSGVGNLGSNLSGGQKQRLIILREILKIPQIYLLDEVTSSLDNNTSEIIKDNLKKLTSGKSLISITHKLNEIDKNDRILVMENGEIIEEGYYEELIENKGFFYNLNNFN